MEILATTLGTRPTLACEIRPEGVVAARCPDGARGVMAAVAQVRLEAGVFRPGLRSGSVVDRVAVIEAMRRALDKVMDRTREVTLVVPDAAVRVLLLDFDALPGKAAEALPVVRFRLKKLLPFEADDAAVSYQVMSTARALVRVVAVAMPREVLAEYEGAVREAGFEPGAVLPSTLAVLAGLEETDAPSLVINAGPEAVTSAIVRGGIVLLHRSVDMGAESQGEVRAEGQMAFASGAGETAVLERRFVGEEDPAAGLPPGEIVQAVSVAAAYFEDTLETAPTSLLSAGVLGATELAAMLRDSALDGMAVREMVDAGMLPAGQGPAGMPGAVPRGWLAGVRGALKS